tara:strand:+ start:984 stop:1547 length:564 start_codon:yes stop_codon:yes gene_type:complete
MFINLKKLIICSILSLGLFSISSINAIEVPNSIEYEESKLILNGKGTRIIFFIKVYDGSLYLQTKSNDAENIVDGNYPMAIRIDVTSTMVTADAMKKALNEGLEKSTDNNTGPINAEITQLSSSFNSGVTSGDYYEFIYLPEKGTHVIKNNNLVELIPGLNFKKAFFGIFLSDNPIQKNLKKAMLGG